MLLENMTFVHLDSDESIFFRRELEHIMSRVFDRKYPEFKASQIIPISTAAGDAADFVTYESYDKVGMFKLIADYASDTPRVDVKGKEFTSRIRSAGGHYGYSVQEIRASRRVNKSLEQRRADAAKKASMALIDKILRVGDADYGIQGFLNHPNIPDVTILNDGTGSSTQWKDKDADKILRDLFLIAANAPDLTNGVEVADTLYLPRAQRDLIAGKIVPDSNGKSVLQLFLERNSYVTRVEVWEQLKGAGDGGTDRAVCGKFDPEHIEADVPVPFEQFAPEPRNLAYVVNCHSRVGGVKVFYPLAFSFTDGI